MNTNTLISASLFYRNDLANGFGVSLHPAVFESITQQADGLWESLKADFCNEDALAGYLEDQLKAIGECKRQTELTTAQQTTAILNIYLLVEHGYIQNDEFNGLLLAYADEKDAGVVMSAMYD